MVVRKHYLVKGSVQGVGFRFRAVRYAGRLGITGYVRNLPDGDVEMELEGERGALGQFLFEIGQSPFIRIEDIVTETIPLENSTDFRVL